MSRAVPFIQRSFECGCDPDNVKASVQLYICSSGRSYNNRMFYEPSMKWSVAILAFTFCSRVLFVKHGRKTVLSRDNYRLAQWAWLKVWRVDALNANRYIFIIDVIDDVDESLQPYIILKNKDHLSEWCRGYKAKMDSGSSVLGTKLANSVLAFQILKY